jgi:hypothetical protein
MELPDFTVDQLLDAVQSKIKIADIPDVHELLVNRTTNLVEDIVPK